MPCPLLLFSVREWVMRPLLGTLLTVTSVLRVRCLLGRSPLPLQVATSVDLDDFPIPTSEWSARTAVIAYTASYFSGMPFQVCVGYWWVGVDG